MGIKLTHTTLPHQRLQGPGLPQSAFPCLARTISCEGQDAPGNGIDTLPETPAGHKGSPSIVRAWESGYRTEGRCVISSVEGGFVGTPAPKPCNHKHAGIRILKGFLLLLLGGFFGFVFFL